MMDVNAALDLAIKLCRRWEGFYSHPYLCPAGVATLGIGSTYYEDGTRVTLKDAPITEEKAIELLRKQLSTIYLPQVISLCHGINTTERLAALTDFTYNLGASNLKHSNLRRKINAGLWQDVPAELRKWVKGGGKVLPGLVKRREAEASLI